MEEKSPSRENLTPAELQAIEEHKYYMSKEQGREVSIEEAIQDFVRNIKIAWLRDKMRRDAREEIQQIEQHKEKLAKERGQPVPRNVAAEEWCTKYAPIWRSERESLEKNGFLRVTVVVRNARGVHMRPTSDLAKLASQFDCDVYVHKPDMPYYNFILNGKPYMNVKSVMGMLSLGIVVGDTLEFIATGREAARALDAVQNILKEEAPAPA